jgi:hypothetical protein
MAIYIRQSPDEVKLSFNLQRRADIISVHLVGASIDSHPEPRKYGTDLSISVGHKCTAETSGDRAVATRIDFLLVASPKDDEKVRVFHIKCSFRVTYQLEKDYTPSPEEIEAFSTANAVFNVWPYFREFAQNTLVRMGLSGEPTVPFLKLIPKPAEKEPEKKDDVAEALQEGLASKRAARKRTPSVKTKGPH